MPHWEGKEIKQRLDRVVVSINCTRLLKEQSVYILRRKPLTTPYSKLTQRQHKEKLDVDSILIRDGRQNLEVQDLITKAWKVQQKGSPMFKVTRQNK